MQESAFGSDGTQKRVTLIVVAAITVVWLVIYASTDSPSVNFIDSGELITALHEPGIAHPPGYPLYTLMGYVVSNVLPGEVAWRVNIFSAFWGALAVGALALLIITLINYLGWTPDRTERDERPKRTRASYAMEPAKRRIHKERPNEISPELPKSSTERGQPPLLSLSQSYWITLGVAISVASLLGASSTFWSRSSQAKMYTLHYAFVTALFLFALLARWSYERKDDKTFRRWLLALNVGLGLSLSNHLMTVLVVPGLLLMLLAGSNAMSRFKTVTSCWRYGIPALLIPILLYSYLPLRASQHPLMDWGSPDTVGDFWRHITGWQYGTYLTGTPFGRLWGFISDQWSWLSTPILLICISSGAMLAHASMALFLPTFATLLTTMFFCMAYGISEIEPYLVPLYIMLLVWLGTARFTISLTFQHKAPRSGQPAHRESRSVTRPAGVWLTCSLALVALICMVVQYPNQNHRDDHLAGQFAENALSELPPNSVLLTDYWDFYSPTLYLQNVLSMRPDIAIIDISLLKYPWYVGYLQKNSPSLIEKSGDLLPAYQAEQRKWVNGQYYDLNILSNGYFGLIDSFIDRNTGTRPAYVLFQPCDRSSGCDSQQVAQNYRRQKLGLTSRLVPKSGPTIADLLVTPSYKLDGLIGGNAVPMDDFARINSCLYADAYLSLSQTYSAAKKPAQAQQMFAMSSKVLEAIPGHCGASTQ